MNMLYAILGGGLLGLYGLATALGWEAGWSREDPAKATARHASGGHRSVWISSYRGGK